LTTLRRLGKGGQRAERKECRAKVTRERKRVTFLGPQKLDRHGGTVKARSRETIEGDDVNLEAA